MMRVGANPFDAREKLMLLRLVAALCLRHRFGLLVQRFVGGFHELVHENRRDVMIRELSFRQRER